jgi:acyl carrier protein
MNDLSTCREQVWQFINKNFYVADAASLSDDASLLERGIIDSTGVIELVEFIETTFAIKVNDTEMVPENLDSIGRITGFIGRKKSQA